MGVSGEGPIAYLANNTIFEKPNMYFAHSDSSVFRLKLFHVFTRLCPLDLHCLQEFRGFWITSPLTQRLPRQQQAELLQQHGHRPASLVLWRVAPRRCQYRERTRRRTRIPRQRRRARGLLACWPTRRPESGASRRYICEAGWRSREGI